MNALRDASREVEITPWETRLSGILSGKLYDLQQSADADSNQTKQAQIQYALERAPVHEQCTVFIYKLLVQAYDETRQIIADKHLPETVPMLQNYHMGYRRSERKTEDSPFVPEPNWHLMFEGDEQIRLFPGVGLVYIDGDNLVYRNQTRSSAHLTTVGCQPIFTSDKRTAMVFPHSQIGSSATAVIEVENNRLEIRVKER